jgi:hypothetical protein
MAPKPRILTTTVDLAKCGRPNKIFDAIRKRQLSQQLVPQIGEFPSRLEVGPNCRSPWLLIHALLRDGLKLDRPSRTSTGHAFGLLRVLGC